MADKPKPRKNIFDISPYIKSTEKKFIKPRLDENTKAVRNFVGTEAFDNMLNMGLTAVHVLDVVDDIKEQNKADRLNTIKEYGKTKGVEVDETQYPKEFVDEVVSSDENTNKILNFINLQSNKNDDLILSQLEQTNKSKRTGTDRIAVETSPEDPINANPFNPNQKSVSPYVETALQNFPKVRDFYKKEIKSGNIKGVIPLDNPKELQKREETLTDDIVFKKLRGILPENVPLELIPEISDSINEKVLQDVRNGNITVPEPVKEEGDEQILKYLGYKPTDNLIDLGLANPTYEVTRGVQNVGVWALNKIFGTDLDYTELPKYSSGSEGKDLMTRLPFDLAMLSIGTKGADKLLSPILKTFPRLEHALSTGLGFAITGQPRELSNLTTGQISLSDYLLSTGGSIATGIAFGVNPYGKQIENSLKSLAEKYGEDFGKRFTESTAIQRAFDNIEGVRRSFANGEITQEVAKDLANKEMMQAFVPAMSETLFPKLTEAERSAILKAQNKSLLFNVVVPPLVSQASKMIDGNEFDPVEYGKEALMNGLFGIMHYTQKGLSDVMSGRKPSLTPERIKTDIGKTGFNPEEIKLKSGTIKQPESPITKRKKLPYGGTVEIPKYESVSEEPTEKPPKVRTPKETVPKTKKETAPKEVPPKEVPPEETPQLSEKEMRKQEVDKIYDYLKGQKTEKSNVLVSKNDIKTEKITNDVVFDPKSESNIITAKNGKITNESAEKLRQEIQSKLPDGFEIQKIQSNLTNGMFNVIKVPSSTTSKTTSVDKGSIENAGPVYSDEDKKFINEYGKGLLSTYSKPASMQGVTKKDVKEINKNITEIEGILDNVKNDIPLTENQQQEVNRWKETEDILSQEAETDIELPDFKEEKPKTREEQIQTAAEKIKDNIADKKKFDTQIGYEYDLSISKQKSGFKVQIKRNGETVGEYPTVEKMAEEIFDNKEKIKKRIDEIKAEEIDAIRQESEQIASKHGIESVEMPDIDINGTAKIKDIINELIDAHDKAYSKSTELTEKYNTASKELIKLSTGSPEYKVAEKYLKELGRAKDLADYAYAESLTDAYDNAYKGFMDYASKQGLDEEDASVLMSDMFEPISNFYHDKTDSDRTLKELYDTYIEAFKEDNVIADEIKNTNNNENTDPRSTEVIESAAETLETQSKRSKGRKSKAAIIEKADELIEEIDDKLKLLGVYDSSGATEKDLTEQGSLMPEKKFKKDLTKFSKTLAKQLGWEHDTNKKNKPIYANTNIAPVGGDGTIILWKPNSEYGVYISVPVKRMDERDDGVDWGNESLTIQGTLGKTHGDILWRITTKKDKYTGLGNNYVSGDVNIGELKEKILKDLSNYEEQKKLKPVSPSNPIDVKDLTPDVEKKIIDDHFAGKVSTTETEYTPRAIITGGLPAAGKSTNKKALKLDKDYHNFIQIDADEVKKYFTNPSDESHEVSSNIANKILDKALNEQYDIVYDSLLTHYGKAKKIIDKVLSNDGQVFITFNNIDRETSRLRSQYRFEAGHSNRNIPDETILKGDKRSLPTFLQLFKEYKDNPDVGFNMFDASRDFEPATLVFNKDENGINVGDKNLFDKLTNIEYIKKGDNYYERKNNTENFTEEEKRSIIRRKVRYEVEGKYEPKNSKESEQTESSQSEKQVNFEGESPNNNQQNIDDEIKDAWDAFKNAGKGKLYSVGIDPELLAAGGKLIGLYLKKGVYTLEKILSDAKLRLGEAFKTYFDAIRQSYSAYYSTAEDSIAEQMTDPKEVRKLTLDKFEKDYLTLHNEKSKENADTENRGTQNVGKGTLEKNQTDNDEVINSGRTGKTGDRGGNVEPRGNAKDVRQTDKGTQSQRHTGDVGSKAGNTSDKNTSAVRSRRKSRTNLTEQQNETVDKAVPVSTPQNYVIKNDSDVIPEKFSKTVNADSNISALRLLKKIESENRYATPEEQAQLIRYVGWGGIPDIFDEKKADWSKRRSELKDVLTDEEYRLARASTLNAHYTDLSIIRATYDAIMNLGFKGGRILEPSMGIGYFLEALPEEIMSSAETRLHGIELDSVTGRIAKQLLPNAMIDVAGYETVKKYQNNYFDLVISNFPFGDYPIPDPAYAPGLRKMIHNYFFVKSADMVRPGGLVVAITSKGTLDAVKTKEVREYLRMNMKMLGAIRLPSKAFEKNANTKVVTDLIFFQKRMPDEVPAKDDYVYDSNSRQYVKNDNTAKQNDHNFIESDKADILLKNYIRNKVDGLSKPKDEIEFPDNNVKVVVSDRGEYEIISSYGRTDYATEDKEELIDRLESRYVDLPDEMDVKLNEYFNKNPEMIIGELGVGKGLYNDNEMIVTYKGNDLQGDIKKALEKLPKDIYSDPDERLPEVTAATDKQRIENDGYLDGQFLIKDGQLFRKMHGELEKFSTKDKEYVDKVKRLVEINNLAREIVRFQVSSSDDSLYAEPMKKLNEAYDSFVSKYGYLNDKSNRNLLKDKKYGDDPNRAFILSLENWNSKENTATKSDRFSKRTAYPEKDITNVDSVKEGLIVSMNTRGRFDVDEISKITGKDYERIIAELKNEDLIYYNPGTKTWDTTEEFLSGNVRSKLKIANQVYEDTQDPEVLRSVNALKTVQPVELTNKEIQFGMNSPWIPAEVHTDFFTEILGKKFKGLYVKHVPKIGRWVVEKPMEKWKRDDINQNTGNVEEYGLPYYTAVDLVEDILNGRSPVVWAKDENNNRYKDIDRTLLVEQKRDKIRDKFKSWLFTDEERGKVLNTIYNEKYNNLRERNYDGKHLTLPGLDHTTSQRLFPHVRDAVWRIVQQSDVLLAHGVGFGKTWSMSIASMELRRLGIKKKPLHIIKNHMVGQYAEEFMTLYPNAKVLAIAPSDFEKANRQIFLSRIANNDWDSVIIGYSVFEKIALKPETQVKYVQEQLDELRVALAESQKEDIENNQSSWRKPKSSYTTKQIEKALKRMEDRFAKVQTVISEGKDINVHWEDLGVDQIFVDEAHNFKNLFINTKYNFRGLSKTDANKTYDLFWKIRNLRERHNKGIVFATGTPVSNSMSELYNMQRYVAPYVLEEYGINHFDSWLDTFGNVVSRYEITPLGNGFRTVERLASFSNVPEIMTMFRLNADVKTSKDIKLNVPDLKGGKVQILSIPPSETLKAFVKDLQRRYEEFMTGQVDQRDDNPLKITNDGRLAAIDLRLVGIEGDYPGSKANVMINDLMIRYGESTPFKGVICIFCDVGTPNSSGKFNLYADIKKKLIEKGIPKNEIAFAHDAKTDQEKLALIKNINKGDIRVILGSTEKFGEGTNAQERMYWMYHLDAPWKPSGVEQRDGRIIRSGNINKVVGITRVITEGSFDSYLWQLLENKSKFIDQVMNNQITERSAEDISERSLSYAEVKAISTGDPRVFERFKIEDELAKLGAKRRAYFEDLMRQGKKEAYELDKLHQIQDAKKETDKLNIEIPEKFEKIIIDGTEFTKRAEANKEFEKIVSDRLNNGKQGNVKNIANYLGFDIYATTNIQRVKAIFGDEKAVQEIKTVTITVELTNKVITLLNMFRSDNFFRLSSEDASVDYITRITNIISRVNEMKNAIGGELKKSQETIDYLKEATSQVDFPQEARYIELQSEYEKLTMELTAPGGDAGAEFSDGETTSFDNKPVLNEENPIYQATNDLINEGTDFLPSELKKTVGKSVDPIIQELYKAGFIEKTENGRYMFNTDIETITNTVQESKADMPNAYKEFFGGEVKFKRAGNIESEEFKKWFGDSKIVDENGKPLITFHFTMNDFNEFKNKTNDIGFHFGTLEHSRERMRHIYKERNYKSFDGSNIIPVYLSIQNPLEMMDIGEWDNPSDLLFELVKYSKLKKEALELINDFENGSGMTDTSSIKDLLKTKGYDGIKYRNRYESELNSWHKDKINFSEYDYSYIAFEPEQIKSAIGNAGTYDPNNPDIRYMSADSVKRFLGTDKLTNTDIEEIQKLNKQFFGDERLKIIRGMLENAGLYGKYHKYWIEIADGTIAGNKLLPYYHEAFHKGLDILTTYDEQQRLFDAYRNGNSEYAGMDDVEIEEHIADNFFEFAKTRKGFTGTIKLIFDKLLYRFKQLLEKMPKIKELARKLGMEFDAQKMETEKIYRAIVSGEARNIVGGSRVEPAYMSNEIKLSNVTVGKIFDELAKDEYDTNGDYGFYGLLGDWAEADYDKDTGRLSFTDTRSSTGQWGLSKRDFIRWLMSDEASVMSTDTDFQEQLQAVREIINKHVGVKFMAADQYEARRHKTLLRTLATKDTYDLSEIAERTRIDGKVLKDLFGRLKSDGLVKMKGNVVESTEKFKYLLETRAKAEQINIEGKTVSDNPFYDWLMNQDDVEVKKVKTLGKTGEGQYAAATTEFKDGRYVVKYAEYTPATSFAKEIGRIIANTIDTQVNDYTKEYKALGISGKNNFDNFALAVKEIANNPGQRTLAPKITELLKIYEVNLPDTVTTAQPHGKLTQIPGDKPPQTIKSTKAERESMYKQNATLKKGEYTDAINWNMNNFSLNDEINGLIRNFSEDDKKQVSDMKRGVRNWDVTEDASVLLGITDAELLSTKPGDVANAEYLYAAKVLLNNQANKILQLHKSFSGKLTDEQKSIIASETLKLTELRSHFMGLGSENARALQILRKKASAREFDVLSAEIVNMLEKEEIFTEQDQKAVKRKLVKTVTKINKEITKKDKILYWYYNSILSNPFTDLRNITGNTTHMTWELMTMVLSQKPEYTKRMLSALAEGIRKGKADAIAIAKGEIKGLSKFQGLDESFDYERYEWIPTNKYLKVLKAVLPTTRLSMEDAFFRRVAEAVELEAVSVQAAEKKGLTVDEVKENILNVMKSPDLTDPDTQDYARMKKELDEYINYVVFQTAMGPIVSKLSQAITPKFNDSWRAVSLKFAGRMIIPFMRISANLMKTGLDNTPLGFTKLLGEDAKNLSDRQKYHIRRRAIAGSMLITGILGLIAAGAVEITGTGPTDKKQREIWEKVYKPNHIYLGNYGISYLNLNPFNTIFALIGNMSDDYKYNRRAKEEEYKWYQRVSATLLGFVQTFTDQSFMAGVSDLLDAINRKDPNYLVRFVTGITIPNMLGFPKNVAQYVTGDKPVYKSNGFLETIQKKLGINEGLVPDIDVFGQQRQSPYETLPFFPTTKDKDAIASYLLNNNIIPGSPSRNIKINGRDLTDKEFEIYETEAGKIFDNYLEKNFESFKSMSLSDADNTIKEKAREIRKVVKGAYEVYGLRVKSESKQWLIDNLVQVDVDFRAEHKDGRELTFAEKESLTNRYKEKLRDHIDANISIYKVKGTKFAEKELDKKGSDFRKQLRDVNNLVGRYTGK